MRFWARVKNVQKVTYEGQFPKKVPFLDKKVPFFLAIGHTSGFGRLPAPTVFVL